MRWWLLVLLMSQACAAVASVGLVGSITASHGHHFQGLDQNGGRLSLYGSMAVHTTTGLSAGVWLGRFRLPRYDSGSTEVDYFVGYGRQLSFNRKIETSLWRYTYTNTDFEKYNWSQWLTSLHLDERFTATFGLSQGEFLSDGVGKFGEVTARHVHGHLSTAISLGRNVLPDSPRGNFDYVEIKAAYSARNLDLFAGYSKPFRIDGPITRLFVHRGASLGVSYTFRR